VESGELREDRTEEVGVPSDFAFVLGAAGRMTLFERGRDGSQRSIVPPLSAAKGAARLDSSVPHEPVISVSHLGKRYDAYVRGLAPVHRLNARENAVASENPSSRAVRFTESFSPFR
jgi:hypothetical protein